MTDCSFAWASLKSPHLRRVPQAFDSLETFRQPPAILVLVGVQKCGKSDPFSPQARWGDDGARQVLTILPTACSTSFPPWCGTPSPRAEGVPVGLAICPDAAELRHASEYVAIRSRPPYLLTETLLAVVVTPRKCYVGMGFFTS